MPPSDVSTAPIAEFATQLEAVGGHAERAATTGELAELIVAIAGTVPEIWASTDVTTTVPALVRALTDAGIAVRSPHDPAEARDKPLGLALARAAIAETGSVLLVEPRVADRSVSLITQTLIVLCPEPAIVPTLDEAAGILRAISRDGANYATFVTGPSRTADIERELTVGVQGPGALHVLFTKSLDDQAEGRSIAPNRQV